VSENIGPHSRRILVFGVVGIPTGTKVNSPAVFENRPELLFGVWATNDFDTHTSYNLLLIYFWQAVQ